MGITLTVQQHRKETPCANLLFIIKEWVDKVSLIYCNSVPLHKIVVVKFWASVLSGRIRYTPITAPGQRSKKIQPPIANPRRSL